jgi:hypothetical protein
MLTPRQQKVVRLASLRAVDTEQFHAHVCDATAGRRDITDAELRAIVYEGLALARLPFPRHKKFRQPRRWDGLPQPPPRSRAASK